MPVPASRTRIATLLLIAVTAVWGSTFFLIKDLVETVPPIDFLGVRFAIAATAMTLIFWRQLRALSGRDWVVGAGLGALYAAAQILQTVGLTRTDASVSGFLTGTYVVLTPILSAVLLRERLAPRVWVATALAMTGIGVLSLQGFAIGLGEMVTLLSAVVYALHIVVLGRHARVETAIGLATVQAIAIAVICLVAATPGGITVPQTTGGWISIFYMALVAGAFALFAQTWAQSYLSAARAAIVMATEPVFAAGFAVAFGGESLTARMLVGGSLVLVAMYVIELRPRRRRDLRTPVDPDRPEVLAIEDPPAEALHHDVP